MRINLLEAFGSRVKFTGRVGSIVIIRTMNTKKFHEIEVGDIIKGDQYARVVRRTKTIVYYTICDERGELCSSAVIKLRQKEWRFDVLFGAYIVAPMP